MLPRQIQQVNDLLIVNLQEAHKIMAPPAKITDFFRRKLDVDQPLAPPKKIIKMEDAIQHQPTVKQSVPRQAYLDVGQKGLGQKVCDACGMCFDLSFPDDTARHTRFHQRFLEDKDRVVFSVPTTARPVQTGPLGDFYIFDCTSKSVRMLVERVNSEMEAAPLRFDPKQRMYLLLREDQVLGMCLVDSIRQANEAVPDPSDSSMVCTVSANIQPSLIGVSRIWTAPKSRGKGIATALLDFVRQNFAKPLTIAKKSMAFSQPTRAGFALASMYQSGCFQTAACLVYR